MDYMPYRKDEVDPAAVRHQLELARYTDTEETR